MAGLLLAYGIGALVFAGILPGILRRYPPLEDEPETCPQRPQEPR